MNGDELRGESVAALLREYADSHPSRRVLLSSAETRALLDERDALRAQVERVRVLDDSICDALCAARQGKYDGMTAAVHLENLLDRFRTALDQP